MSPRVIIFGGTLLVAAPALAQIPVAPGPAPKTVAGQTNAAAPAEPTPSSMTPAELDRLRADVGTYRLVLQRAVEHAGQQMAQWAQSIQPGVYLTLASQPVVSGVPVDQSTITFHVELSEIIGTTVWQAVARRQPPAGEPRAVPSSDSNLVLTAPPASGTPSEALSPDAKYSEFVREALIDAMLDESGVLNLKDSESLSVWVTPVDVAVINPLYKNTSHTLILSIKGRDLALLRQLKIPRDEAKRRIIETRF